MPAPAQGTSSPLIAEPGMSPSTFFNTEYDLLDSDDSTGNSPLPFLEFINDSDALQALEASRAGDTKALRSPTPHLAVPQAGATVESPSSGSSSESSSSSTKRTESASSTKTDMASGDVMMTDGLELKTETDWDPDHYVNGDVNGFLFDGTIDPSSIENTFDFGDRSMDHNHFDFASASSTPSPFATTATSTTDAASPQTQFTQPPSSVRVSPYASSSAARNGHNKAFSQYSLTQSMNGLSTRTSREVSPAHMVLSHDSSPSAFINSSPSPADTAAFLNGPANGRFGGAVWPHGLSMSSPHPQANGIPPQMAAAVAAAGLPAASAQFPMFRQPSQPVVPQLFIGPTPAKSRVETQIPIRMSMSSLPPSIRRLHLPTHTISKPKLLAKPRAERSPDMLELSTMLVCTSAMANPEVRRKALARAAAAAHPAAADAHSPEGSSDEDDKPQNGGEVKICDGCVTRERKRAARKKAKKPEEEERWSRDERKRVVVFNTQEIKEWQMPTAIVPNSNPPEQVITGGAMQIDAPMRIACYCRHHGEKSGFQVIFTVKDYQGQLVAQALSPSIMITDDHKTHTAVPGVASASTSGSEPTLAGPPSDIKPSVSSEPGRSPQPVSDIQGQKRSVSATFPAAIPAPQATAVIANARNLSRPPSPNGLSGPSSKKRKSSSSPKVPSGLAMTRLETSNLSASQPCVAPIGPAGTPSPFTPSLGSFPVTSADAMFGQHPAAAGAVPNPFTTGPPTPNSNDQVLFSAANRSSSMDNLSLTQMYSAPVSAHPSRAPSPNGLRNSANAMQQQQQQQAHLNQALSHNLFNMSMPVAMAPATPSVIHKVIPNEGPKSGGIEVTILGEGFYQGLEVIFGDRRATTTTFWGETSLVCLLPPSHLAGPVRVTLKGPNGQPAPPFSSVSKQPPLFNYIDDYENQLIRSALSVMSHKMTGKLEDAREIARRLMFNSDASGGGSSAGSGGGGYDLNFETQLLRLLEFLDLDDSSNKARLNLRRRTGQTMLHLACALGLHRFVAGLLARGANPDARDKGGYTPMHFAALNDHPEIVRRLIQAGADPTIRTIGGLTPAEVATSRDVLRAIRRIERHARSRSGGSLHSRASSATSLRSLWEPAELARATTAVEFSTSTEESESTGESPEYTSGDLSSEDVDADEMGNQGLYLRRSSTHTRQAHRASDSSLQVSRAEDHREPASPTAAMSAFREQFTAQFQQFQQAMTMHLQNLPHFPYFTQMPNMPPLPDYQAYLNTTPVLQRMTSLLPHVGRGGPRPGSAGQQPQTKELDTRWWDLSSLMSSSAPPPAYEDIFPQSELDQKQASAAQAAADAEADSKCAILYDQTTTTTTTTTTTATMSAGASASTSSAASSPHQTPKVLEIGRKHHITQEQQENLRRAHAKNFKGLRSDKKLFLVWIPLLLVILCAMLYSRFPGLFAQGTSCLPAVNPLGQALQDRAVEVN